MASRLRFTTPDDICLLREVLGSNPFEDSKRWANIVMSLRKETGKNYCLRTVKEHAQHLLQLWKKEDRANLRKSGTEEQYGEKEHLLQQIADMARDFKVTKPRKSMDREKGIEATDFALLTSPTSTLSTSSLERPLKAIVPSAATSTILSSSSTAPSAVTSEDSSRRRTENNKRRKINQLEVLQLVQKKNKDEKEWRREKLQLEREKIQQEERRLDLEWEKFQLEKEERLHRIEMEKKQQAIMEKIVNLLGNK